MHPLEQVVDPARGVEPVVAAVRVRVAVDVGVVVEEARVPQPAAGVSYARKIARHEAWLSWGEPAAVLARRVRAFDPEPGACSLLGEGLVKIWSAEAGPLAATADPGTVVSAAVDGIGVACGDGVLMIHELQRAGGRRLRAREFLAGTPLPVGTRWQTPTAAAPR